MDLMEFKAKEYFDRYRIPGPAGFVVSDVSELKGGSPRFPCMVKAQVRIGGRGKAGGIRPAQDRAQLESACRDILGMDIKGHLVKRVLIVEQVQAVAEWYLAIALDRSAKRPVVIFSPRGGVDIEETARSEPGMIFRVIIDPVVGLRPYVASYLISKSGVDVGFTGALREVLRGLYALYLECDCTLAEINPLAALPDGSLQALDAKVSVDDSALFRHGDLEELRDEMEENPLVLAGRKAGVLFIPCDPAGDVAVMSNGSGMIMSCIDVLAKNGMSVCAALDLGGGPTAAKVREATRIALAAPGAKALFINIFGGITRCDEVAGGVKGYMEECGSDKLVVTRFEGTNKEKGVAILDSIGGKNVFFADGLYEGVEILKKGRASL